MEANYNADMYLIPSILNDIEDKIEIFTEQAQEFIYNNTSSLKTIEENDDLSGKTLYLSFPRDIYEDIDNTTFSSLLETNNNYEIRYGFNSDNGFHNINIFHNNLSYIVYGKFDFDDNPYINIVRFKLPNDFGIVTTVDTESDLYNYVKIYDDETMIPNYVKKTWVQNEIPYIQDIDNIEQGIYNLGDYVGKPLGWVNTREWLKTNSITERNDYNVGNKGISYNDVNRWITDLNLLETIDMENGTFWNTNKTEYVWHGHEYYIYHNVLYNNEQVQYNNENVQYWDVD